MEEVENMKELKEVRQEYSNLRVSKTRSVSPQLCGSLLRIVISLHNLQSEYHELNRLRQQLKKQEAKCKKEVDRLKIKIQELDDDSRSGCCVLGHVFSVAAL